MVAVPEYRRRVGQLRLSDQQLQQVSTSASTFGGQVGAALQGVAGAVGGVADALTLRQEIEEDASVREAFNKGVRPEFRRALNNPQDGYLNRTGGNAIGVEQTAMDDLQGTADKFGANLSPRARRKYDALVDDLQDQAYGRLLTHSSNETRNYAENQHKSTIAGFVEEAATNWGNPELFQRNLDSALAEQARLAALQGWAPETLTESNNILRSGALRQRITTAANEDPLAAQELLNASREQLSHDDETALDLGLEDLVRETQAEQFTQGYIRRGSATPRGAPRGNGVGVVQAGAGYTVVRNADGSIVRRDGTRAWRNNNPGNIEYGDFARGQGAVGTDGRFAVFSTYAEGRAAKSALIFESGSYRNLSIAAAISRYAPAFENDTGSYTAQVAAAAGVPSSATMNSLGPRQREAVLDAMERVEGFRQGTERVEQPGNPRMPGGGRSPAEFAGRVGFDRVQALIQNGGHRDTEVNRRLFSHLGETANSVIGAADITPSLPARIALPPEVMAENPAFAGMTVGEVYDTVAAAVGDDPVTRQGGNYFDAEAAYNDALAIEDPKLRAEVLRNLNTMTSIQNSARSEGRASAQDEAWKTYAETGQTDFSLDMRQRMGQSGWTAFQSAVRADQQGIDVTNPDTWEALRIASSNPSTFADINLVPHYENLSRADRRHFINLREEARTARDAAAQGVQEGRTAINFDRAYEAAGEVFEVLHDPAPPNGASPEDKQEYQRERYRFEQRITEMTRDFYDRENRDPNTVEVRDMAAAILLPIKVFKDIDGPRSGPAGWLNTVGTGSLFEAADRPVGTSFEIDVSYDDVPLDAKQRIASQLLATGGDPTPENIVEAYEQQQLMAVGLPPVVNIGGVPEWLIAAEKEDNPEITDEELIQAYQLFLMSR